jgi:hypothetical protein
MLDKLGGVFAPKPSPGPHKQRECLPLCLILRNRLKYALTYKEVTTILQQRLVKVDGKVRRDKCYPTGIMDVVSIDKTDEHFRIIYDAKGRFVVHRITALEAQVRPNAHPHLPGFFLEGASASSSLWRRRGASETRAGDRARTNPPRARSRAPPPPPPPWRGDVPRKSASRAQRARPPPLHRPSLEP